MGVRFLKIGRGKANAQKRIKKASKERDAASDQFQAALEQLANGIDDANNRAGLTAEDLYGDSIRSASDSVRANANNTKAALARVASAGGADVTGGVAAAMDGVDEQANNQIGGINRFYADRASTDKEQALARKDRLASALASLGFNNLQLTDNNYNTQVMLDLKRKQANRQLGLDIFQTIADSIPKPAGPSGG